MSELNDLFAMYQGEESPEDYIWITHIPVPEHPFGTIEIRGTSPEHCMEAELLWMGRGGCSGGDR